MSRSGYTDECDCDDQWSRIRYRGAVTSAIKGARGQRLLKELVEAMDAMPAKELIADELEARGSFCALGVVGKKRELQMGHIDPDDSFTVSRVFDIAEALAREIVYINDEGAWGRETPQQRWVRVRAWTVQNINKEAQA